MSVAGEESVEVSLKSYINYIFYNKINYIWFPIAIVFFLLTEGTNIAYSRLLSQYDSIKFDVGTSTFNNINDFWITLGCLIIGYFVFSIFKYFILNIVVLFSNE